MKITELEIRCNTNELAVRVWVECHTQQDIEHLIAWMQLARDFVAKWEAASAEPLQPPPPWEGPGADAA